MTLLDAACSALAQLEHLHGPQKCLSPGNCPTLAAIQNLTEAIAEENARRVSLTVELSPETAHAILRAQHQLP